MQKIRCACTAPREKVSFYSSTLHAACNFTYWAKEKQILRTSDDISLTHLRGYRPLTHESFHSPTRALWRLQMRQYNPKWSFTCFRKISFRVMEINEHIRSNSLWFARQRSHRQCSWLVHSLPYLFNMMAPRCSLCASMNVHVFVWTFVCYARIPMYVCCEGAYWDETWI